MNENITILVIDDEPELRFATSRLLKSAGYRVLEAASGQEGLEVARQNRPDLILTDVVLPDIEGTEVCRQIKAEPELANIFVILISGRKTSPEDQTDSLNIGADGFITRPFSNREFLARIQAMVRLKTAETALRRTQETLRESEEKYRQLVKYAPAGIYEIDLASGRFISVNDVMCEYTGYSREEFLALELSELLNEESQRNLLQRQQRILSGHQIPETAEYKIKGKNGQEFWVLVHSRLILEEDQPVRATVVAHDITRRKQTEEEIRLRNRELAFLNQFIVASAAGMEPEEFLEMACRELVNTFDIFQVTATLLNQDKTAAVVAAEYTTPGAKANVASLYTPAIDQSNGRDQTILVKRDPALEYLLNHKAPLVVDNIEDDPRLAAVQTQLRQRGIASMLSLPLIVKEEVVGSLSLKAAEPGCFSTKMVSLAWSVADQIAGALARYRLSRAHHRLLTAIEQTAEIVVITDTEGTILYTNPAIERITGYSQAEMVGQNPRILKSGHQCPEFYQKLWATITAGQVWRGRFINKKKDGSLYTEEATITPIRDDSGTIVNYVAVKHDITRELELEEQYQQSQKMEAVGRLAGGVAHDFNNLLTTIMGYTGLALHSLSLDDPLYNDIAGIQKTAERAANLTRQLLAFARKQVINSTILNLNDLVLNIDKMLRRLIGEDIELVTLPGPDLGQIKADPGQLEQILVNLTINARDAMPGGGKLTIETANVILDEQYAGDHTEMPPGRYVMLSVTDTGIGMSEEVKARIFEPFFTTKEKERGTGLGLATCFGIVKQNNGHIQVFSKVGEGTTFKVYLPRVEEEINPAASLSKSEELPQGMETILLVEDETAVRELAGRMLRQQGYQILEAINGEEALRLVQEQPQTRIDLLLTDMVMPQLGGKALAIQLRRSYPHLKILFTSGYTDDVYILSFASMDQPGELGPDIAFLPKPFSLKMLAYKVREVLDS